MKFWVCEQVFICSTPISPFTGFFSNEVWRSVVLALALVLAPDNFKFSWGEFCYSRLEVFEFSSM